MSTPTALLARSDLGDGAPALFCLPGWCGGREVFGPLLEHAGHTHRALSVDWPGHGESPALPDEFGTYELVDQAVDVIADLDLDTVVPVALSHAGWIALELRRRLGATRVPGIVLIDWMPLGAPPGFLRALTALQDPNGWRSVRDALFASWTEGVTDPAVTAYVDSMADQGFEMWARAGREISRSFRTRPTPAAVLTAFARAGEPCPTLHLYAQPDDPEHLAAQQAFAREHRWFTVRRLDATSHFPCLEQPTQTGSAIDAFLRTIG